MKDQTTAAKPNFCYDLHEVKEKKAKDNDVDSCASILQPSGKGKEIVEDASVQEVEVEEMSFERTLLASSI